jgi:hypothetical protein
MGAMVRPVGLRASADDELADDGRGGAAAGV